MTIKGEKNRGEGKQRVHMKKNVKSSPKGVLDTPSTSASSSDYTSSSCGGSDSSPPHEKSISSAIRMYAESHGVGWKGLAKKKSAIKKSIPFLGGYEFSKRQLLKRLGRNKSAEDSIGCGDLSNYKPSLRYFTLQELMDATDNFSPDNLVGEGGHAKVYRGCLANGQAVAVKKLKKIEKNEEDRVNGFLSELGIIAHINHPNTARVVGFSISGGLHLVLLFSDNGSLDTALHGEGKPLDWKTRYRAAVGIAEGLHYIHYECNRRIVHRDITSSNILFTEHYEPQISDFGLSKWLPDRGAHHVASPIEGTFGYMAPEYFMHGIVHEKTDVFSFGVLLLELITGQRAVRSDNQSLALWAKPHLKKKSAKEIADPRLADSYDNDEMQRVMFTAASCIHHLPNMRPTMDKVVQFLKGENEPDMKSVGRSLANDACDLEDYTSTSYLNGLNRHMQLMLEF